MLAEMRLVAFVLICIVAVCNAKVVNTEADASYLTKVYVGVSQALQWLQDWTVTEKPPRPSKKVQLALVGLGRTGSTSFSTALKELGYTPIHDDEAAEVGDIYGAMTKGTMTMDQVNIELGQRGFDAPMVSTRKYVEWAATAPDIKVILTVRDKKKWAESWLCVTPAAFLPEQRPFAWVKAMQDLAEFNREVMIDVPTNGHPELYQDITTLEAGYEAWVDFVRKTVPSERLLEFDVKQGWGPLCEFLGKPVPSTTFPHINDKIVVDIIIKVFIAVTWIWPLILASPLLLLYCLVRCCCRTNVLSDTKKRA